MDSCHQANRKARHGCPACGLSRRRFLGQAAAGAAALSLSGLGLQRSWAESDLNEFIELSSFRPQPRVRIQAAVVRLKPPYWLGWPGTAYDLEGHRKRYDETFASAAKKVGLEWANEPAPLESDEAVNAFVEKIKAERPDAVLVSTQHLSVWHLIDRVAQAGIPMIVFAPIGTAFTHQVAEISRRPGVHVVSSLEVSGVEQAFRMVRAKHQLEASRLLVVAGTGRSESVLEGLGTKIRYIPRNMLHELFARMPENDEARSVARRVRRSADKIVEPNRQDLLNVARAYTTAKRLLKDEKSNGLTTDCLGMVTAKVVPTPPCMAASLFQDGGVTYGCEADVFAAISLMFVSYLFDKPAFINDPVPETVKNVLIAAHCTSGTRLRGFDEAPEPLILRSHSESDIGVATQVLWREGQPATLVRFQDPNRLILDTGTVVGNVSTPPAGGCRTSVEIAMDRVEDCRDVLGFHQVVFYGDHRRDVEAYCQMYGIQVINSPERAPAGRI